MSQSCWEDILIGKGREASILRVTKLAAVRAAKNGVISQSGKVGMKCRGRESGDVIEGCKISDVASEVVLVAMATPCRRAEQRRLFFLLTPSATPPHRLLALFCRQEHWSDGKNAGVVSGCGCSAGCVCSRGPHRVRSCHYSCPGSGGGGLALQWQ